MLGFTRRYWLKFWTTLILFIAIASFLLIYFLPSPPSAVLVATSQRGGGYEFLGLRYQAIMDRVGINLVLLRTSGSAENVLLLEDETTNVKFGFVQGGVSNASNTSTLLSLGRVNYQPFWIFYRGQEVLQNIQQLKGKRIAVGADGSGTQIAARQIFELSGVDVSNTTLSSLGGNLAVTALREGEVDVAFLAYSANAPIIKTLLREPGIKLMSVARTEALARIFPHLVALKLPQGVIDFAQNIPPFDINLIGTTNAVLVRKDLHPQIVQLLVRTLTEEHRKAGLFEKAGEFPTSSDPEYAMSEAAVDFYRNGSGYLHAHLPFWMVTHVQRFFALAIAIAAIFIPLFNYVPRIYRWFIRERLRFLYRRLRKIESTLQTELELADIAGLEGELESVDKGATILGVPLRHSDLFFSLKVHINLVRMRLAARKTDVMRNLPPPVPEESLLKAS